MNEFPEFEVLIDMKLYESHYFQITKLGYKVDFNDEAWTESEFSKYFKGCVTMLRKGSTSGCVFTPKKFTGAPKDGIQGGVQLAVQAKLPPFRKGEPISKLAKWVLSEISPYYSLTKEYEKGESTRDAYYLYQFLSPIISTGRVVLESGFRNARFSLEKYFLVGKFSSYDELVGSLHRVP